MNRSNRGLRALCPSCGAPVEFKSGDSVIAVCGYCTSTLLRKDDSIERLGKMAELFDDHSPLQLGVQGSAEGRGFALIGRLQYRYPVGTWNEWRLLFDDGQTGWLSEDNGRHVLLDDGEPIQAVPFEQLQIDQPVVAGEINYRVAGKESATVIAGAGELPFHVGAGYPALVADLRGPQGEFATLDYRDMEIPAGSGTGDGRPAQPEPEPTPEIEARDSPVQLYVGRAVTLAELNLNGLRSDFGKQVATEPFQCPACGAPVQAALVESRTLSCAACASVIDLTQGIGQRLTFFRQQAPRSLRIPIHSAGSFEGVRWTVVGYQERSGAIDGEEFVWEEFLLHEPMKGFRFLIHDDGHWTWMEPLQRSFQRMSASFGRKFVQYGGRRFDLYSAYPATVTYVAGEFYWQVVKGETSHNEDYIAPPQTLSCERTDTEITWTQGRYLSPIEVGKAFGLKQPLPKAKSQGMIQPAPRSWRSAYLKLSLAALVALVLIQGWLLVAGSSRELVAPQPLPFDAARSQDHLVEVTGSRPVNLVIASEANLTNDAYVLYVDVAARDVSPRLDGPVGTGAAAGAATGGAAGGGTGSFDPAASDAGRWQASREVGFWEGRDSDGYWSEGSRLERVVFKVPPGKYLLRISAERDPGPPAPRATYRVSQSSRPTWLPFLVGLLGLFVLNVVGVFGTADPEAQRWSNSMFGTPPGRAPSG